MSLENKESQIILDNIYLIRFKILYDFYEDYFYNKYNNDDIEITNHLQDMFGLSSRFLYRNLSYLIKTGYLNDQQSTNITFKGIKFIETVTDGKFDFPYEQIKNQEPFIIRKFQENDSLE